MLFRYSFPFYALELFSRWNAQLSSKTDFQNRVIGSPSAHHTCKSWKIRHFVFSQAALSQHCWLFLIQLLTTWCTWWAMRVLETPEHQELAPSTQHGAPAPLGTPGTRWPKDQVWLLASGQTRKVPNICIKAPPILLCPGKHWWVNICLFLCGHFTFIVV